MTDTVPASLRKQLEQHGQSHLVRWWGELSFDERAALAAQIEQVDFAAIRTLWEEARRNAGSGPAAGAADSPALRAEPPRSIVRRPRTERDRAEWDHAARMGRELLSAGRVGVVLVAGGQGTRLGFSQPKGMFPVAPISGATLYQLLAEQVLARSRQAGASIPYFVMTSEATNGATRAFYEENGYFGLDRDDVYFFQQGDMPAVDASSGRLLLAEKGKLSRSPDGHGGLLQALAQAGLLEVMRERGIDVVFYHQVDNPTVIVCDPAFLGWHALQQAEISLKVVAKRSAEERMGVVVGLDGKTRIIEYSDFPPDVAARTDAEGKLVHWAGSTAIHVFSRSILERVARSPEGLPFHAAVKKVPFVDEEGRTVQPDEPNAVKFERFIFDILPQAERVLVVEADRAREFNPVKNETGDDSPETARRAMSDVYRDWLHRAGAETDADAPIEISPLKALDADDLRNTILPGTRFRGPVILK